MTRPEKQVDWKLVDQLLVAGCLGTEIAAHFDMHPDTFYHKVEKNFNMGFTAYSQEKRQKGDSLLRSKQFEKAMKGDNVMLVWLGKNRLGQKEHQDNSQYSQEQLDKYDALMSKLDQLQEASVLKNADSNKSND